MPVYLGLELHEGAASCSIVHTTDGDEQGTIFCSLNEISFLRMILLAWKHIELESEKDP